VVLAVPGQERHPAARHLADQDRLARLAERRLDRHLLGVGEELVEAGAADDPDIRDRFHGGQATFSPEDFEDFEDDEDDEDDDAEEEEEEADADEEALLSPDEDEALSPLPDLSPPPEEDESAEDPDAAAEDDAGSAAVDPLRLSVR
jgi:hypothetical protein